jgi:predicted DNA binding CopG/RHH family protein
MRMARSNPSPGLAGSRIPAFPTVEEAAEFWDTHSLAEFEDELEEVDGVQVVKAQPKKGITIRLEEDKLAEVRRQAREKGIGPSTLIRMWVLERLQPQGPPPIDH